MKLTEAQSKIVLGRFGIASPWGRILRRYEDVAGIEEDVAAGYVVKPQCAAPKAKRAEQVRFCSTVKQLRRAVLDLFQTGIEGEPVREILAERRIDLVREHYVACIRREGKPFFLAGYLGGGDIQSLLRDRPDLAVLREMREEGLSAAEIQEALASVGFAGAALLRAGGLAGKLIECFTKLSATFVEINPLGQDSSGDYYPLDASIVVEGEGEARLRELLRVDGAPATPEGAGGS